MTFNVWSAEDSTAGRQQIVDVIQQSGADIVGFQEMTPGALRSIASSLGYYYYDQRLNSEAIMSRYRIVETLPQRYGARIELAPGHDLWMFNTHLFHAPYGPYQLNGITYNGGRLYDPTVPENIPLVVQDQVTARGRELSEVLASAADSGALSSDAPAFLTGDFNEASHLDWTAAAVNAGVHVAEVPWPTSRAIAEKGFQDSWREVFVNEVDEPGRTWSPVYPSTYLNRGDNPRQQPQAVPEPQDRIDMVYYAGANVTAIAARRSGPVGGDVTEELEIARYPSDHNAVTTTFRLTGIDGTRLNFQALGDNDSSVPSGYGSRVLSSPNVAVTFSTNSMSPNDLPAWRFRDDGVWPDGVGQLVSGTGEPADGNAVFRVTLTPDAGYGIDLESFALLGHANDQGPEHFVHWEVLTSDMVLASGQVTVPSRTSLVVDTGLDVFANGPLELKLTHLSGTNNSLGFDNLSFRQVAVPEPGRWPFLFLAAMLVVAVRAN
jgi:endonuclease/exonuclease/phosphatase family metal-dependent hydrolase